MPATGHRHRSGMWRVGVRHSGGRWGVREAGRAGSPPLSPLRLLSSPLFSPHPQFKSSTNSTVPTITFPVHLHQIWIQAQITNHLWINDFEVLMKDLNFELCGEASNQNHTCCVWFESVLASSIAIGVDKAIVLWYIDSAGEYRIDRPSLLMAVDWCSGDQRRRWSYDVRGGVHDWWAGSLIPWRQ